MGEDLGGGEKGGLSQSFPQKAGYSLAPPSDWERYDWALSAAEKMKRERERWPWVGLEDSPPARSPRWTQHRPVTKEVRPEET